MNDTPAQTDGGPSNEFLATYGSVMSEWSNIEVNLCLWFRHVASIPDWEMAYAVFFSARSFNGRADMFNAALEHSTVNVRFGDQCIPFLKEVMLKVLCYNGFRNQMAHGFHHWMNGEHTIAPGKRWWQPGDVRHPELLAAQANLKSLRRIIYRSLRDQGKDEATPLQEWREQLRLLPNEACSSGLSRKQKGRLLQLLTRRKKP